MSRKKIEIINTVLYNLVFLLTVILMGSCTPGGGGGGEAGLLTGVTWVDDPPGPDFTDIFFSRSIDGGATFEPPVNVSATAGSSSKPVLAIFGRTVLIAWVDDTPGTSNIFLTRSTNGGVTFEPPVNVSNTLGDADSPQLAVSGSSVLVVWTNTTLGNSELLVRRSTDGGATFEPPVNVSNNQIINSYGFELAFSGSTVLIAWEALIAFPSNANIFVARSDDGGATFGLPVNVYASSGTSENPRIAISGSTVLIAWEEWMAGVTTDIYVSRSTDGGATYGPPTNVSNTAGFSEAHRIAISGTTIIIAWEDTVQPIHDILVVRSSDSGATFGPPVNLTPSHPIGVSMFPWVMNFGSDFVITWMEETNPNGNSDILITRSTDSGVTFGAPVNVSNDTGDSTYPQVVTSGSMLLSSWFDNTPGSYGIFVARSSDEGGTFGPPVTVSTLAVDIPQYYDFKIATP